MTRRPFKELVQAGGANVLLEGWTQSRPGHVDGPSSRRRHRELIQIGSYSGNDGDDDPTNCTTRYFDSSGVQLWHKNHGAAIRDVSIDPAGNVYEVGDAVGMVTLRKRSPTGKQLWTRRHGATLTCCAVTPAGGIVAGGAAGTDGYRVRQWDLDGNLEWSANAPYDVLSIDCDLDGNVILNSSNVAFPIESWVTFLDVSGGLIDQTDYAYNDVGTHEVRRIVAVCFDRTVSYPYTVDPIDRWQSAIQRTITPGLGSSWWIVSLNGNTGVAVFAANPTDGAIASVASKKVTGTYARSVTTAGTFTTGVTASILTNTISGFPARDQILGGGTVQAIGLDGRIFAASTILRAVDPQTPVSTGFITDPWVTPPWQTSAAWTKNHHGQILGVAVNDSGNSVLGGVVATI